MNKELKGLFLNKELKGLFLDRLLKEKRLAAQRETVVCTGNTNTPFQCASQEATINTRKY